MSHYEGVEPTTYEITWVNGHVEKIQAHAVAWPGSMATVFGGGDDRKQKITFHAEIDGRWTLQLSAWEDDIRTIRNCATEDVHLGGGL